MAVPATPADDAPLVIAARAGDTRAFSILFERWFDRCYDVAWRIVRDQDAAADVAQETFIAAWRNLGSLRDPEAFGGWVLRTSRNTALTRIRRDGRVVATEASTIVDLTDRAGAAESAGAVSRPSEVSQQHDMVWAAACALGERDASVLDLHLRHGLEPAAIAAELGVAPNAAHQVLFRLRQRLGSAIRAWVLWRDGRPRCVELRDVLITHDIRTFGPEAVRVIDRHARDCPACAEERSLVLAPEALFASVPMVAVDVRVRTAARVGMQPALEETAPAGGSGSSGVAPDPTADRHHRHVRRRAMELGAAAAAVLVVALVLASVLGGDDESEVSAGGTTTSDTATGGGGTPRSGSGPTSSLAGAESDPSVLAQSPVGTTPGSSPAAVGPTEPGLSPGGGPESTVAPTSPATDPEPATTTVPPAPPPPTISEFTVIQTGLGVCGSVSGPQYELRWVTAESTEVTILGPNVGGGSFGPTGTTTACTGMGVPTPAWTLTATGAGGSVSATASPS